MECIIKSDKNFLFQRPVAQELLRHRFIKTARKTSYLIELIEKYQRWRREQGKEEEDSSNTDDIELVHLL